MRNILFIPFLALVLLPMLAKAQVNYAVSGNTATVAYSPNATGDVVIASIYNGYPVTRINGSAFSQRTGLTSITIPDSVTSIGSSAFYNCASLTNVTMGNGVTSIGNSAFDRCYGLTSITVAVANPAYSSVIGVLFNKEQTTLMQFPGGLGGSYVIPNSVTSIWYRAFSSCARLTSVTIPNSVTSIGSEAFSGCTSLTSVAIPNSVTTIGNSAFYRCYSLTSVTIPSSVTTIGKDAFSGCTSLTSIAVAAGNLTYSSVEGVLFDKEQRVLIDFPEGLGGSYVIPNSVTALGHYAFFGCTHLTSVTIPNGVASVGIWAFSGCTSLISITFPNSTYSLGEHAFDSCTSLTSVTIPNNVFFFIGDYAFRACTSLTSVTIPNSVNNIGNGAFSGCTSLTGVTIPNSITEIKNDAFSGCTNLANVTIDNSVTRIGYRAFAGCASLTSVTIPNSVTAIWNGAFAGCASLTSITVAADNPVYSSVNGVLFNKAQTTLIQFPAGLSGSYVIPYGVTSIQEGAPLFGAAFAGSAFAGASLTSITIPDSVTSIGDYVFSGCASLTSITIPNSVTSIGDDVFSGCASLTSITIPNSVTSIGDDAFSGCTSLTSITIPNSVTSIGDDAFSNCASLTSIAVAADNPDYSSVNGVLFNKWQTTLIQFPTGRGGSYVIPNNVFDIRDLAFSGCTSLTSVTIPNSVNSIGNDAFSGCASLTSIAVAADNPAYSSVNGVLFNKARTVLIQIPPGLSGSYVIPNGVISIEEGACYGASLTSVTIPNSVTNIENGTFFYCASLTSITVAASHPVFSSVNGVLFNKAQTILIQFPAGLGGSYVIPNSVTSIEVGAFFRCASLTSVTIPDSVTRIGYWAFYDCTSLTSITFLGDAPLSEATFSGVAADAKAYYYYGTKGWSTTYYGLPTVMLGAPAPQIASGSTGLMVGGFGFTIAGVPNQVVTVEASTNLVNWQPVQTLTLSSASANFTDPQWTNYPNRFYRVRSD